MSTEYEGTVLEITEKIFEDYRTEPMMLCCGEAFIRVHQQKSAGKMGVGTAEFHGSLASLLLAQVVMTNCVADAISGTRDPDLWMAIWECLSETIQAGVLIKQNGDDSQPRSSSSSN